MHAACTAEQLDDLIAWGATLRSIARHVGCSPSSLSTIRRRRTHTVSPRIADAIAKTHHQVRHALRTARHRRRAA